MEKSIASIVHCTYCGARRQGEATREQLTPLQVPLVVDGGSIGENLLATEPWQAEVKWTPTLKIDKETGERTYSKPEEHNYHNCSAL